MLGFIIVGWPEKKKAIGDVGPGFCEYCRNQSIWFLMKTRRWATLFWIPIVPLSRKRHYLVCDVCGTRLEIEGETVTEAKGLADATDAFRAHEIEDEEYNERVNEFWMELNDRKPQESETPEQIKGIQ